MDLVWLVCLRPLGCHLLNFFEISGREFRSSAVKLRPVGRGGAPARAQTPLEMPLNEGNQGRKKPQLAGFD